MLFLKHENQKNISYNKSNNGFFCFNMLFTIYFELRTTDIQT